ncbi:purine and uridine phosphorylase [Thozetella sp. PMI_491]|nr:purine and uridine phosphorylase [Thozetella sp. PMI_491]
MTTRVDVPVCHELTHSDFTVGWVCALPKEQTAATVMLDQRYPDLPKPPNDPNTYTLGAVGGHNVVIACLPKGKLGTISAATVATWMVSTFPSLKFGLMVGIGGGVPPKVRLGDVVVSTSTGQFPGVVQWDFGKAKDGGHFERTGSLNNPPMSLLTALTKLETEYDMTGSKIPDYLEELKQKWPRLGPKYLRSDSLEDILFKADYGHVNEITADNEAVLDSDEDDESCRLCNKSQAMKRKPRELRVHYGLVASGNQVIKDAAFRDRLNKDLGGQVLCIEMEAAGLMDNFPCIVIRGICDYADSHKNKDWQEHAAAVAAAFAKELMQYVQPTESAPKEDVEILDWLTTANYGARQSDNFARHRPGTGRWLLESSEFQDWLATNERTLFCPGIPGAGKTILASIVVNYLNTWFQNDATTGIAYVYCNFQRRDEQSPRHLLASILKQLAESQPSLPRRLRDLFNLHKDKRTRPSLDEISGVLESVAAAYSKVFVVVDALDECQASDRFRFLSGLFELQKLHKINILATSRFIPEIVGHFTASTSLEIRAHADDVREYLDGEISQSTHKLLQMYREEIKTKITEVAQGMFLLAHLYFEAVKTKKTLKKITGAYDHAYEEAMKRIEGHDTDSKELAKQVLSWVIYAKRPLSVSELQCALTVEFGKPRIDLDNLPQIEDMVSVCAGLVTVDEESQILRLVHYTTQEFFDRTKKRWFPDAESEITSICVTYLSFDVFESGPCKSDFEFEYRLQSSPLYNYAACNWGHHAKNTPVIQATIDFLESENKAEASGQALSATKYTLPIGVLGMKGLHVTGYFGMHQAVDLLINRGNNPDPRDTLARTPLWIASQRGHESIVKLLLETGQVDEGHESIVKLLLETGQVDINQKDDGYDQTPLWIASYEGHESIVKLLRETGQVDVDQKDNDSQTPLRVTSQSGNEAIARQS